MCYYYLIAFFRNMEILEHADTIYKRLGLLKGLEDKVFNTLLCMYIVGYFWRVSNKKLWVYFMFKDDMNELLVFKPRNNY